MSSSSSLQNNSKEAIEVEEVEGEEEEARERRGLHQGQ